MMSEEEPSLFLENGQKAGLYDVCEWWCYVYPDDIFVTAPMLIVEIREKMKEILKFKKRELDKWEK